MQPIKVFAFFLISFGALLLLENVTDLNIPVAGTLISVSLIAFGIMLIRNQIVLPTKAHVGNTEPQTQNNKNWHEESTVFGTSYGSASNNHQNMEYNVVFGSRTISFDSQMNGPKLMEINAVFGAATLLIPRSLLVDIKSEVVFGDVRFPNGNNKNFGDANYQNFDVNKEAATIIIKATVVFGNLRVYYV